jgi:hypothetical protein
MNETNGSDRTNGTTPHLGLWRRGTIAPRVQAPNFFMVLSAQHAGRPATPPCGSSTPTPPTAPRANGIRRDLSRRILGFAGATPRVRAIPECWGKPQEDDGRDQATALGRSAFFTEANFFPSVCCSVCALHRSPALLDAGKILSSPPNRRRLSRDQPASRARGRGRTETHPMRAHLPSSGEPSRGHKSSGKS